MRIIMRGDPLNMLKRVASSAPLILWSCLFVTQLLTHGPYSVSNQRLKSRIGGAFRRRGLILSHNYPNKMQDIRVCRYVSSKTRGSLQ